MSENETPNEMTTAKWIEWYIGQLQDVFAQFEQENADLRKRVEELLDVLDMVNEELNNPFRHKRGNEFEVIVSIPCRKAVAKALKGGTDDS